MRCLLEEYLQIIEIEFGQDVNMATELVSLQIPGYIFQKIR
jgi:hypothetical protein